MHPHLHCVVPGGGYSQKKKRWVHAPQNYLLPIEVLKRRFRSRFLVSLKALYFVRIRYYGLISNRNKSKNLEACYQALGLTRKKNEEAKTWEMLLEEVTGVNPKKCPVCEHGELVTEMLLPGARGSPGENSIAV